MARRKYEHISISALSPEVQEAILDNLRQLCTYVYDTPLDDIVIIIPEKFANTTNAIPRAISSIKRFLESQEYKCTMTRSEFCEVAGISRPTLNKWIKEGIITTASIYYPSELLKGRSLGIDLHSAINELKKV